MFWLKILRQSISSVSRSHYASHDKFVGRRFIGCSAGSVHHRLVQLERDTKTPDVNNIFHHMSYQINVNSLRCILHMKKAVDIVIEGHNLLLLVSWYCQSCKWESFFYIIIICQQNLIFYEINSDHITFNCKSLNWTKCVTHSMLLFYCRNCNTTTFGHNRYFSL